MSIQSQKIGGIVFREQHYGKVSMGMGNFTTKVYDPEKKEWYVLNTFAPDKTLTPESMAIVGKRTGASIERFGKLIKSLKENEEK